MKTILLMDIVIAAFGLYLVFVALGMKRNGKINTLVIAEHEQKKCRDTKAYIAGVVPYMYFFGIVALVVGVIGILGDLKVLSLARVWSFIELALFWAHWSFLHMDCVIRKKNIFKALNM